MKLLINYSDHERFHLWQRLNNETAIGEGLFDKVISYSPKDIDADFRHKNQKLLRVKRGGGYWVWKPYIIKKALAGLNTGDFLFYLDCDIFLVNSITHIIETCLRTGQDIIPFEVPSHIEKTSTKRDTFILMDCDTPPYTDTIQMLAALLLLRKSDFTIQFVDRMVSLCAR